MAGAGWACTPPGTHPACGGMPPYAQPASPLHYQQPPRPNPMSHHPQQQQYHPHPQYPVPGGGMMMAPPPRGHVAPPATGLSWLAPLPPHAHSAAAAAAATGTPAAAAAAFSWLMPGKNPTSALYEYTQAKQRGLPAEQRAAWQVRFEPENGTNFQGSVTVRSGGHEATATAPDLKTAKMRAAGQLMRLLCPEYAQLCQSTAMPPATAAAPALSAPAEEPEEGEII